jgi:hypothetical protein
MMGVSAARGDTTSSSRPAARWILAPEREDDIAGREARGNKVKEVMCVVHKGRRA